ncbi:hypothetical protein FJT64_004393 [Amphibalanus amphitrite]|uniref:Uncharacterized protein n=1 Tax=Amphibalanus amphitrite TaxID=1232801 RepID=A0A6A4VQ04_AMPAM|nr:hypothetical protein FJT64_004393 [Amphibalanus amphitrite]
MQNLLYRVAESDNDCPTPNEVNEILKNASQALEKVAHEEFTEETRDALVDSTTKVNNTVDCVKHNQTQFTDDQKNSVQVSIKNAEKSVDKADDIIDNIVNPTPMPLPSLALSSPFVIALITLSCLLAVGTLVGVALTVHRSVRTPPRRRRPRPTVTGRVNAGYRPADTDTTELVERPVGRRRAPAPAPVPEPEGYDRLYQGAIPRAHTVDRPGSEPQQTPRREFYNAY